MSRNYSSWGKHPTRKDRRKDYRGAKAIDYTCRNHGSCPYCQRTRNHKNIVRIESMNDKIKDFK